MSYDFFEKFFGFFWGISPGEPPNPPPKVSWEAREPSPVPISAIGPDRIFSRESSRGKVEGREDLHQEEEGRGVRYPVRRRCQFGGA